MVGDSVSITLQASWEAKEGLGSWVSRIWLRKPAVMMEQMSTAHKYGMTTIDAASAIVKSMELATSVLTQAHKQELSRHSLVENGSTYDANIKFPVGVETFDGPTQSYLDLSTDKRENRMYDIAESLYAERTELNRTVLEASKTSNTGLRNVTGFKLVDESIEILSKSKSDKISQLLLEECKTLTNLGTQLCQQQARLSRFMSTYLSEDGANS